MEKIKPFIEFINEWLIKKVAPVKEITREDMDKSLGYGSLISLECDTNRIKGLLWMYLLSIGNGINDGFGFDRRDMDYWCQLGAKVIAYHSLNPLEMEQLRAKMYYYSGQLTKIANYEILRGPDMEIEKHLQEWIKKNAHKYKETEITPAPSIPKQGDLF